MKSVLVIDENKDTRDTTVEILKLAGYRTIAIENGKKGMETVLKEKPDVIVCDSLMRETDQHNLQFLLRKTPETQHIPFIFRTSKTGTADLIKEIEIDPNDYISKPFQETGFLNNLEVQVKKPNALSQKNLSSLAIYQFLKDVKNAGLINNLSDHYPAEAYNKKQNLFRENKHPRYLYYVVKGKVKGYKTNEYGKNYITDIFIKGDFIGYHELIEDINYDTSAMMLEDSEIIQVPKEDFLKLVYSDMNVAAKFLRLITQNVREKEERLVHLAYSSLRKRVAKALADLHSKYNFCERSNNPIEISREDIAHYVGTATESLIRTLSDFKAESLIEIKEGKIYIADIKKIKNLLY
ncbi:MAG: cyclic nucleotide-binding domain-containing protein [Chitinophagaceae bacterium]